ALLEAAKARRAAATVTLDTWEQFEEVFAGEGSKFAWCHWDGSAETEAAIKDKTKVTVRCIPLPGQGPDPEAGKCIFSGKPSPRRVLMAKAY
ncbi:MAG: proline--tRNA ligase, partial [Myxococcales bacterium]|nr:proline--tRNA ligase [Myxococcales bacterium]